MLKLPIKYAARRLCLFGVDVRLQARQHVKPRIPLVVKRIRPRHGQTLVDGNRASLAGRVLADLRQRPDLAARLSQIDVSDSRDAVIILKGDTALVRIGDDQFVERITSSSRLDLSEDQVADSIVYAGHAYAVDPAGTPATMARLTRTDVANWHKARSSSIPLG